MINYLNNLYLSWKNILSDRSIRNQVVVITLLYFFLFKICRILMTLFESREGTQLMDPLLFIIPAYNLSEIIFALTYAALATFILSTIIHPITFIIGLQGYCLLIIMRTLTIYLVPLEPPVGMILLKDPVTIWFMSKADGGYIVKDLFFSGHVSTVMLFFFASNNKIIKRILLVLAISLSSLILIQHVHYTIDVVAAPFFAFLAFKASLYLHKLIHQKKYSTIRAEY